MNGAAHPKGKSEHAVAEERRKKPQSWQVLYRSQRHQSLTFQQGEQEASALPSPVWSSPEPRWNEDDVPLKEAVDGPDLWAISVDTTRFTDEPDW